MNLRTILSVSCGSLMVISLLAAVGPKPPIAPLLEGMGSQHHEITTVPPQAQRYVDEGLALSFGFNHQETARSFRQAQAARQRLLQVWSGADVEIEGSRL